MEVARLKLIILLILFLSSCSNSVDMATGEIKILRSLERLLNQADQKRAIIDARNLLSRDKINQLKIPILFVELPTGQNGTLVMYPDQGVSGTTWIGADGATISLQDGLLLATRGLGHDLMGGEISIRIKWSEIDKDIYFKRQLSYLDEGNVLNVDSYTCNMVKIKTDVVVKNFDFDFVTSHFEERCANSFYSFRNDYYVDKKDIVRRANFFHSRVIGNIYVERLDR